MKEIDNKKIHLLRRKNKIRSKIRGNSDRPRLSVNISNRQISAQIIDDAKHQTLVYVSSLANKKIDKNLTVKAEWVGTEIAKQAKDHKIKQVIFDRNGKIYHGRIAKLAEAARKGGLEF